MSFRSRSEAKRGTAQQEQVRRKAGLELSCFWIQPHNCTWVRGPVLTPRSPWGRLDQPLLWYSQLLSLLLKRLSRWRIKDMNYGDVME